MAVAGVLVALDVCGQQADAVERRVGGRGTNVVPMLSLLGCWKSPCYVTIIVLCSACVCFRQCYAGPCARAPPPPHTLVPIMYPSSTCRTVCPSTPHTSHPGPQVGPGVGVAAGVASMEAGSSSARWWMTAWPAWPATSCRSNITYICTYMYYMYNLCDI